MDKGVRVIEVLLYIMFKRSTVEPPDIDRHIGIMVIVGQLSLPLRSHIEGPIGSVELIYISDSHYQIVP